MRNHSQPLKLQQNIKNCHKFAYREDLRKLQVQLEIPSCLEYGPKCFSE